MRVVKFVAKVVVAGVSASLLALSGIGAAYAAATPAVEVDEPIVEVEDVVHHNHVHDLINIGDVIVPVSVFAPIYITDVLNDIDVDVLGD